MMWNFDRYGESLALISENGQRITYTQLGAEARKLAEAIGGRCLVFTLCKNTPASLLGYAGLVENGIVPALLNASM